MTEMLQQIDAQHCMLEARLTARIEAMLTSRDKDIQHMKSRHDDLWRSRGERLDDESLYLG